MYTSFIGVSVDGLHTIFLYLERKHQFDFRLDKQETESTK